MTVGAPNLDVRLTRSVSGSILDIDFVGVLGLDPASASATPVGATTPTTAGAIAKGSASTALVSSGRKLKILEHRVHKVEMRHQENGEAEEELVVSNLRPFTLNCLLYTSPSPRDS